MSDPLSFANPRSLDELFNRDPLDLADQDIDVIVAEFRKQRAAWLAAEGQPKAKAAPKAKTTKPNFSLAELGLLDE